MPETSTAPPTEAPIAAPPRPTNTVTPLTRAILRKALRRPPDPSFTPPAVQPNRYLTARNLRNLRTSRDSYWQALLQNPLDASLVGRYHRQLLRHRDTLEGYHSQLRACMAPPPQPSLVVPPSGTVGALLQGGWYWNMNLDAPPHKEGVFYPVRDVWFSLPVPRGKVTLLLRVNLGTFHLYYDPVRGTLNPYIYPPSRPVAYTLSGSLVVASCHPHTDGQGNVCLGGAIDLIRNRLSSGLLMEAVDALEGMLRNNVPNYRSFTLLPFVPPEWRIPLFRNTPVEAPLAPLPPAVEILNPDGSPWTPEIGEGKTTAAGEYTRICGACLEKFTSLQWKRITTKAPHKWVCTYCIAATCHTCGTSNRNTVGHCPSCHRMMCRRCCVRGTSPSGELVNACSPECLMARYPGTTLLPETPTDVPAANHAS